MKFKNITIQNFFSFGPEPQTIDLSNPGLYLITGKNKQSSDSNGSGKSTIFDAISYALFGRVTKSVTLPQIVNETTGQDCMVELEFEINSTTYIIERWKAQKKYYDHLLVYKGSKDEENLISKSDKKETQELIDSILRFNYKSFINSVMMTQENINGFLQADPAKKKEIIENILQLNIVTKYHDISQQKRKISKRQYDAEKQKEESLDKLVENTKLSASEYVESCKLKKKQNKDRANKLREELDEINKVDIGEERKKIDQSHKNNLEKKILQDKRTSEKNLLASLNDKKENIESTIMEYQSFIKDAEKRLKSFKKEKLENEKNKIKEELENTKNNPERCPVCGGDIHEDHLSDWMKEKEEQILSIEKKIKGIKKEEGEINDDLKKWNEKKDGLSSSLNEIDEKISEKKGEIKRIDEKISSIKIIKTMDEDDLNKIDEKRNELKNKIENLESQEFLDKSYLDSLLEQAKSYSKDKKEVAKTLEEIRKKFYAIKWWELAFSSKKNSMKSWFISNVIEFFNSKIKFYMDRFFDGTVSINLDNNLNETVASNGIERSYGQFSGGEKMRLNLAILFALNDLIKTSVTNQINIMFLDEVLSNHIDSKGISTILDILQDKADTGASIFVIDHRENFKDYPSFKNITVTKEDDGFSYLNTAEIEKNNN